MTNFADFQVYAPVDEMYVVLKKFTKDDQSNKWECMLAPIVSYVFLFLNREWFIFSQYKLW